MSRPTIRHLAIMCRDPEKQAKFYEDVFEMEVLHKSEGRHGVPAIYMTDGHLTVALLPCTLNGESPPGMNHYGWKIDDGAEIAERLAKWGVEEPKQRPSNRPYAEKRAWDLEGNLFDLSEHGYSTVETQLDREKRAKEKETV